MWILQINKTIRHNLEMYVDLVKLNFLRVGLGSNFSTAPDASKNNARFKSGQKSTWK